MLDFRPVFFVIGLLVSMLSIGMLLPAFYDALRGDPDWQVFLGAAALTLFVGVSLMLTNRGEYGHISVRQAFLLTTLSWVALTAFAALPFHFSRLDLSYADAFFEAMSGITTTGSTVISGLDTAPPGILLWRALLQWLGGIGIIVMAIAIMPMLSVGGMQLFRTESSEKSEKVLPRAAQIAAAISSIYVSFTAITAIALWFAGMTGFDAVAHAMTTIATGGFSTRDASIAHFDSAAVDWIVVTGMILSSLPYVLYLHLMRGNVRPLWRDAQVRGFFGVVLIVVAIMTLLHTLHFADDPLQSLRYAAFNVVSVITGTGYATADYGQWGPYALTLFFVIMFIGGCAGSTTCGIKIFRFQVLWSSTSSQFRRLIQPHGIFVPYYNNRPVSDDVMTSVLSFFFVYVLTFVALTIGLGLVGLDFLTAVSGAGTAISNVGPGLGNVIGPAGNFGSLPDAAKWLLSFGMLLGRLELFTVLVLLTPAFWKG